MKSMRDNRDRWRLAPLALLAIWPTLSAAQWRLSTDVDKMTSKKTTFATVRSGSSLSLPFPYSGANFAELTVRQHPAHGLDVMFGVDKGQITCHSFNACALNIRFDDQKAESFAGSPPSDRSSNVVFLKREGAKRFIERAKKAKRILVEATYYQAGSIVSEFTTPNGLPWPP